MSEYIIEVRNLRKVFKVPASESLGDYLAKIVNALEIIDLTITEPKLENIVARMYDMNKKHKEK